MGIYPQKIIIERDACTPKFIVALFTITRTWKQPRCALTAEWIQKLWCIYTMEYYSAIKKNIVSPIEVNEPRAYHTELVSQKEKDKYGILTHAYGL